MRSETLRTAGVILAGGAGKRIGGDKPFRLLGGKALIEHVIDTFRPQVRALWISARDNADALRRFKIPVVADRRPEKSGGALAAMVAAIEAAMDRGFDAIATVPCDAPFLPADVVARLTEALLPTDAPGIIVRSDRKLQPTIGLWRASALGPLSEAFDAGDRKLSLIFRDVGAALFDADRTDWSPHSFFNVNTPDDLARASDYLG